MNIVDAVTSLGGIELRVDDWGIDAIYSGSQKCLSAPINSLFALHAALQILEREGIENSWQRHAANHELLRAELEQVGIEFIVAPDYRLPQLNSVTIPGGVDDANVRSHLLNEFDLEIGAGLGPLAGKIWRIGLMGASSTPDHVSLCVKALKSAGVSA